MIDAAFEAVRYTQILSSFYSITMSGTFTLETSDLAGVPISAVEVGQPFQLRAFVEDLRSPPQGVFAAYLDVHYDAARLAANGPISYGAEYAFGQSGDTSAPGLIDEVGAFDGVSPLGGGQFLLFQVPFLATASGPAAFFIGEPADDLPAHDVLLYGLNEPISVDDVLYGQTTIAIRDPQEAVPEPGACVVWVFLSLTAAGVVRLRRRMT